MKGILAAGMDNTKCSSISKNMVEKSGASTFQLSYKREHK